MLLDTGFYADALDKVRDLTSSDSDVMTRVFLLRGWACLRLNRYAEAREHLARALEQCHLHGDIDTALDAERGLNTILRDLGHHPEAASHARRILQQALSEKVPLPTLAGCYRVVARSHALTGQIAEALEAGEKALKIGRDIESLRAIGNAELSLGEACRHGKQLQAAADHYRQAVDNADRIANRDSFLWSGLGLSDTLLLMGLRDAASQMLERVAEIVRDNELRYPLENCHWAFSIAILDFLETFTVSADLDRVLTKYRELGIRWPAAYFDHVARPGEELVPKQF